jgi:hypothetical protein
MWTSRRKLQEEITRLTYRVADLEERLCPCEDHDWKQVGYYITSFTDGIDCDIIYKYKCKRCGNTKECSD